MSSKRSRNKTAKRPFSLYIVTGYLNKGTEHEKTKVKYVSSFKYPKGFSKRISSAENTKDFFVVNLNARTPNLVRFPDRHAKRILAA